MNKSIGILNSSKKYWFFSILLLKGIDTTKPSPKTEVNKAASATAANTSAQPKRLPSLRIPWCDNPATRTALPAVGKYTGSRERMRRFSGCLPADSMPVCLGAGLQLSLQQRRAVKQQHCCLRPFLGSSLPQALCKATLLCLRQLKQQKKPFSNLKDSKIFSRNDCYCIPALPRVRSDSPLQRVLRVCLSRSYWDRSQ